jgi:3-oxoacyl-[acyl-carrier protein] reductase
MMDVAIVTGGGGALGKGIAARLKSDGWRVVLCDLLAEHAQEVSDELGGLPWKVLDVTRLEDVRRVFHEIAEEHGTVGALVNSAGGAMSLRVPKSTLADSDPEHWDRMIGVNIYGNFNTCHTIAPMMKKAGRGGIVSIASGAGMQGGPPIARQSGAAVYSATKAGVIAFTQALSQELGPYGIRVNAVSPGRNESRAKPLAKMLEMQATEEKSDPGSGRISPLGRFGRPSDIGDAVGFLLSEQASHITGCCLDITGGIRMH